MITRFIRSTTGTAHWMRDNEHTECGRVLSDGTRLSVAPRTNRCSQCQRSMREPAEKDVLLKYRIGRNS